MSLLIKSLSIGNVQPLNIPIVWTSSPKFIDGKLNTSEFVYRLNLPSIEERFNDQGKQLLDISDPKKRYTTHKVSEVFKPEWVFWRDITWRVVVRFYKDNYTGRVHNDGHPNIWGINWVVSGYATVSFWDLSKIDSIDIVPDEQNNLISVYNTSQPPCKTYIMPPGAYLINAGLPHLASGFNKRLVFSLRMIPNPKSTWDKVVNHFSDLII